MIHESQPQILLDNAESKESSPAMTAAQIIRANFSAFEPGISKLGPRRPIRSKHPDLKMEAIPNDTIFNN